MAGKEGEGGDSEGERWWRKRGERERDGGDRGGREMGECGEWRQRGEMGIEDGVKGKEEDGGSVGRGGKRWGRD